MKRKYIITFGICLFFFCFAIFDFLHSAVSGDEYNYSILPDWDDDIPSTNSLQDGFVWLVFMLMLILSTIIYYITKIINFIKNYTNKFISKYIRRKRSND